MNAEQVLEIAQRYLGDKEYRHLPAGITRHAALRTLISHGLVERLELRDIEDHRRAGFSGRYLYRLAVGQATTTGRHGHEQHGHETESPE